MGDMGLNSSFGDIQFLCNLAIRKSIHPAHHENILSLRRERVNDFKDGMFQFSLPDCGFKIFGTILFRIIVRKVFLLSLSLLDLI